LSKETDMIGISDIHSNAPPRGNLAVALAYAARGWHVVPCWWIDRDGGCTCENYCKSPGKHPIPKNGLKAATTDPAIIRSWWGQFPQANVAIRTGAESGIWVLDLDGAEGIAALEVLEAQHGPLPRTISVLTGGGGRHLYFRLPKE
jgi:putative DNA primase/helicase